MFHARCPGLSLSKDAFSRSHGYDRFVVALIIRMLVIIKMMIIVSNNNNNNSIVPAYHKDVVEI